MGGKIVKTYRRRLSDAKIMSISNNILAAFVAGVSTKQEDELIMKEFSDNEDFSDLLDVLDDVDAVDGMNELKNEFLKSNDCVLIT